MGYFTAHLLYSSYTSPGTLSFYGAASHYLGCFEKGYDSKEDFLYLLKYCDKKATEHKKTLDKLFGIVL